MRWINTRHRAPNQKLRCYSKAIYSICRNCFARFVHSIKCGSVSSVTSIAILSQRSLPEFSIYWRWCRDLFGLERKIRCQTEKTIKIHNIHNKYRIYSEQYHTCNGFDGIISNRKSDASNKWRIYYLSFHVFLVFFFNSWQVPLAPVRFQLFLPFPFL